LHYSAKNLYLCALAVNRRVSSFDKANKDEASYEEKLFD
jgi:hypothetical protein